MPKLNQMFPSKFLAAADLEDQDKTLTISGVDTELVGQGDEAENKWIVYFEEVGKGLVLNKTNGTSLGNTLGDDTDDWIGKRVILYPTQVSFSGKMVDCIRVKEKQTKLINRAANPSPPAAKGFPPKANQAAPASSKAPDRGSNDLDPELEDDPIPF